MSHPARLKAMSIVILLTTALARPLVHTLGIEFHEEDVPTARVGVPIQWAFRVACHPGAAISIHLRKLIWTLLQNKTKKEQERKGEKPIWLVGSWQERLLQKLNVTPSTAMRHTVWLSPSFPLGGWCPLLDCSVWFSLLFDSQWFSSIKSHQEYKILKIRT